MPANPTPFPHLPLLFREGGPARLVGGGAESPLTKANKANRAAHSGKLRASAANLATGWQARPRLVAQREVPFAESARLEAEVRANLRGLFNGS